MSLGYVLEGLLDAVDRVETAEGAVDHQHEPTLPVLRETDQPVDHTQTCTHQLRRVLERTPRVNFLRSQTPRLLPLVSPGAGLGPQLRRFAVRIRLSVLLFLDGAARRSYRQQHIFRAQQVLDPGFLVVNFTELLR